MNTAVMFKQFRQERHLSLRQASANVISASTLSRFEQGKTHLSAVTFVRLLERMQVDWSTFTSPESENDGNLLQQILQLKDSRQLRLIRKSLQTGENLGGGGEPLAEYIWLSDLLLKNEFGEETPTLEKSTTSAMGRVLNTDPWSTFTLVLAKALIQITPLQSLPALLATLGEQLRQKHITQDAIIFFSSPLTLYQEGVIRLLREGHVTMARNLFDQIQGVLTISADEAFLCSVVSELLRNAEERGRRCFEKTEIVLNSLMIVRANQHLHALVPQIAPVMKQQHFSTVLFDVEKLYADYGRT
ncbi:helix-turn-helix domain-containing protein [Schleiferilactobacillus perolens]|uniref:helix-turn-helix domain-containing protein n=2 Tax=Schleiferilactobacillus perolens TaxID=100468 RepID=UPI002355C9BC|nr:helix-turn-helix transcriptional regulator [Schleiferilactobacillus perolens]MCI2172211.1 helix-turn-helix domain-containing protein [Schleiferilactobacillus perolens]